MPRLPDVETTIKISNTARAKYRFPVFDRVARHDGTTGLRKVGTLVLGDAADRTLPDGVTRGVRCPSPDVIISMDEWAELGPRNQTAIRRLADTQVFEVDGLPEAA